MSLPNAFLKLSLKEKFKIFHKIQNAINQTSAFKYPMIFAQLEDDVSKVKLYNDLVTELFSANGQQDIKTILGSYELAMSSES